MFSSVLFPVSLEEANAVPDLKNCRKLAHLPNRGGETANGRRADRRLN